MRVRKKAIEVEAEQWLGFNMVIISEFMDDRSDSFLRAARIGQIRIYTLEGCMLANIGDWIIKGIKGEFYPCKENIFKETYDILGEVCPQCGGSLDTDNHLDCSGNMICRHCFYGDDKPNEASYDEIRQQEIDDE